MKELPILFSGPMVRAILHGRKTQTRRVVKPQPYEDSKWGLCWMPKGENHPTGSPWYCERNTSWNPFSNAFADFYRDKGGSPYGGPGDRLWVRETHRFPKSMDHEPARGIEALCREANYRKPWAPKKFEADGNTTDIDILHDFGTGEWGKLRPSIFMPRWASRITLEVVSVRVERLQEISEADAVAEGCAASQTHSAVSAYEMLWDSINAKRDGGKFAWAANPWVWVVTFKTGALQPR